MRACAHPVRCLQEYIVDGQMAKLAYCDAWNASGGSALSDGKASIIINTAMLSVPPYSGGCATGHVHVHDKTTSNVNVDAWSIT